MAINLNIDKYGAQFSAFVEFAASQEKHENYIARIETQRPELGLVGLDGKSRKIAAKTWDGYGQFLRSKDSRTINNEVRTLFLNTILGVCGVSSVEELPPVVQAVLKADDYDGKGRPLTVRRIKAVTEAVKDASAVSAPAGQFASGSSPAVGRLHDLIMTAPGIPANATPEEKANALAVKIKENTTKEVVTNFSHVVYKSFVTDGAEDFSQKPYQFERDRGVGQMGIYVAGSKGRRNKIAPDFETARDQLVQFITGNDDQTFETATESVRKRTGLLMSVLTQFNASATTTAFQNAIARQGLTYQYTGNSQAANDKPMDYTLDKTPDGDIKITLSNSNGVGAILLSDKDGNVVTHMMDGATSCCTVNLVITIPDANFRKLAGADWAKFDFESFHAAGSNLDLDAQIARIPDELRLDVTVDASLHFQLDAAPEPQGGLA